MAVAQIGGEVIRTPARPEPGRQFIWQPVRIGPSFEWLDHDRIRILEGRLADRRFHLRTEIHRERAFVSMSEDDRRIGEVNIEREPPGKGIVLWDAGVREDLRGSGLCSIMTWCIFRELLEVHSSAFFRIRMVRSLKAGQNATGVQNVGMAVMASRLGFTSELDLERLLSYENISGIDIIGGHEGSPPALKIDLRVDPLSIVAFALSPDTMRPMTDFRTYTELKSNDWLIHQWASEGLISVNGDYCLRRRNVSRFVNCLAIDEEEAKRYFARVRGL